MAIALDYSTEPARRGAWYGQLYVQVLVAIAAGVSAVSYTHLTLPTKA